MCFGWGTPEFYVTYETAYRYVGLALRGALPLRGNGLRRQQWTDIASRVRAIMESRPDFSMGRALVEVIDAGDTPSFYLSYPPALSLYYRLIGSTCRLSAGTLV